MSTSTSFPSPIAPGVGLPMTLCYLNGAYTALCDAKISVVDRGFIFEDGMFPVVPLYDGTETPPDQLYAGHQRAKKEPTS